MPRSLQVEDRTETETDDGIKLLYLESVIVSYDCG